MKNYTSINDIDNINSWIEEAKLLKANPLKDIELGKNAGIIIFQFKFTNPFEYPKSGFKLRNGSYCNERFWRCLGY
jgi:N-succinyl-L-ornithine transcarbamylase